MSTFLRRGSLKLQITKGMTITYVQSLKTASLFCSRFVLQRSSAPYYSALSISSIYCKRISMSSRRSARLSTKPAIKIDAPNDAPVMAANISKKRKTIASEVPLAAPSTPKRKKSTNPILPPVTPTPAAIGLMTAPYSSGDVDDSAPPPVSRLVIPNGTNAPLISPETRRRVTTNPLTQVSPSKVSNIKTTTGNILDQALEHLVKVEPKLKQVIEQHPCHVFSPEGLAEEIDPFRSLVSGIISQQVSHS